MNVQELVRAVNTLEAPDAFRPRFNLENWRVLGSYLIRRELRSGEVLIEQGAADRGIYFLESGSLQVFARRPNTQGSKIALLRAGALVGEPSLFADTPRMAQVEALSTSVVWVLNRIRLDEMRASHADIAYELLRACGAVMAERMRLTLERGTPSA